MFLYGLFGNIPRYCALFHPILYLEILNDTAHDCLGKLNHLRVSLANSLLLVQNVPLVAVYVSTTCRMSWTGFLIWAYAPYR